jgi:hypothetical protein
MHGNRYGKYVAKGLLEDVGYQVSVMCGHNHRLNEYTKRGEDYAVRAAVSGCLCKYPHYMKGKRLRDRWQLGTAIAEVNIRGREVRIHNLLFNKEQDRVWVWFERKHFESNKEQ